MGLKGLLLLMFGFSLAFVSAEIIRPDGIHDFKLRSGFEMLKRSAEPDMTENKMKKDDLLMLQLPSSGFPDDDMPVQNKKKMNNFLRIFPEAARVKRSPMPKKTPKAPVKPKSNEKVKDLMKTVTKTLVKGKDTLMSIIKKSDPTLTCEDNVAQCSLCVGKQESIYLCLQAKFEEEEESGFVFTIVFNDLPLKSFRKIKVNKKYFNFPCLELPVVGNICVKLVRLKVQRGLATGCFGAFFNGAEVFSRCVSYNGKKLKFTKEEVKAEDFAQEEEAEVLWPDWKEGSKGSLSRTKMLNIMRVKTGSLCEGTECHLCHHRNDEEICSSLSYSGGEFQLKLTYDQEQKDDFSFSEKNEKGECHSLKGVGKLCLTVDSVKKESNGRVNGCYKLRLDGYLVSSACGEAYAGKMSIEDRGKDNVESVTSLQFPSDKKTVVYFGNELGSLQDFDEEGANFIHRAMSTVKCETDKPLCNICAGDGKHEVCATMEHTKASMKLHMALDGFGVPVPEFNKDTKEVEHYCNPIQNLGMACVRVNKVELKSQRPGICFDLLVSFHVYERKCFRYDGKAFQDTW